HYTADLSNLDPTMILVFNEPKPITTDNRPRMDDATPAHSDIFVNHRPGVNDRIVLYHYTQTDMSSRENFYSISDFGVIVNKNPLANKNVRAQNSRTRNERGLRNSG
ncbi:MAG: hypothetical protein VW778_10210, partial [Betaproteobacteria bacterium]